MIGPATDPDIARALRALDHAMPVVQADMVIAAARARAAGAPRTRRRIWLGAIGPGVLSACAFALAAALMPGPLRHVIARLTARHVGPQALVAGSPSVRGGGIALAVRDSAEVDFQAAQAGGVVRITIGSGPMLTIRGPMHGPRYRVNQNRVVVSNAPEGDDIYDIEIPPAPVTVVVRVGPRIVFSTVTIDARRGVVGDAGIRYVVPLGVAADTPSASDARRPRS